VITAYVANPLVYAMICKRATLVYPKEGLAAPPAINQLRENILRCHGFGGEAIVPFVLNIPFQVWFSPKDKARIYTSQDSHVKYYLKLNPCFQNQTGLLTLIPVTWYNPIACIIHSITGYPLKKFIRKNIETSVQNTVCLN